MNASGLELRGLGAQLAYFDGGEYASLVSTEGFDIHTHNAKLFGIYDGQGEIKKPDKRTSKNTNLRSSVWGWCTEIRYDS